MVFCACTNTHSEGIHVMVRGQFENGSFHLLLRDPGDRALVRSDNRHLYLLSLLAYVIQATLVGEGRVCHWW